jgi:predicted RNA binding protein YcfA (HicA-like mRNA interferase family)
MDSKTLIRLLEERGWKEVRRESSHRTYKHPEVKEIITVQHPRKDLPIGTLQSIRRIAGLR